MEINNSNLETLGNYLKHTLSPETSVRKPAEAFLESVEGNQNYPVLLLNLVDKAEIDSTIRVAGAVTFKNYVKRNWKVPEDGPDKIHPQDRDTIKTLIVDLMLKSPELIQKQLSDAVSIIGREDFPGKWPSLMQEMVTRFNSGDFHIINGILHTAHSLFKRYRYEFKSQELWLEIKYVLENFAKPLTDLFEKLMELANTHTSNASALKVIFNSLVLIAKVFYNLNFQDLPEFFEDNMNVWMMGFLTLLTVDNKLLQTSDDEEEPGLLEQLKSQICDNVVMYAQKYDEEFQPYLSQFMTAIWHLLTTTGQQVKYDSLVSNAIHFLATVAEKSHCKELFEDPVILSSICEKIIIPNMEFRQSDEELFEDNPDEYIRRDIEGSDIDTRRRAACELVKSLSTFFEAKIMEVFSQYVQVMLQKYTSNPSEQWKSKDAAIYLVTSMAVKGQTAKYGITQTSELVNITDFYKEFILPDLQKQNVNEFPVLKADAIKYVMIFRNQLPRDIVLNSLPLLTNHLTANSCVVHTYAAHAIERIFMMKNASGHGISTGEVQPIVETLLKNLFATLEMQGSLENEYVMKAIMRTFSLLQESVIPYLSLLLPKLTSKLILVSKNPSKPHFNHFLFETLSLSIRIVCKTNRLAVATFEEALFPIFQEILLQDCQEFAPYVFQILSLLLELRESPVPDPYMVLFPCLLTPVLWQRPGNIHPLVRLLQAYIEKGARQIGASNELNALLGVFQKLIASKANDHEGFYILQSLIEHLEPNTMEPFLKQIFSLLFQRVQSSKTTKYVKSLLVFFFLFAHRYDANMLIAMIDGLQPKMFGMVLERLIIPDVQKVSGPIERKICAVGLTKLLTESPAMIEGVYANFWAPLLQAIIGIFELPEDDSIPEDEHYIEIEDTPGYQIAYSQLVFAGKNEHDPFGGSVQDARLNLAQALYKLSVNHPGKMTPLISTGVNPEATQHLQKYLLAANVQLV